MNAKQSKHLLAAIFLAMTCVRECTATVAINGEQASTTVSTQIYAEIDLGPARGGMISINDSNQVAFLDKTGADILSGPIYTWNPTSGTTTLTINATVPPPTVINNDPAGWTGSHLNGFRPAALTPDGTLYVATDIIFTNNGSTFENSLGFPPGDSKWDNVTGTLDSSGFHQLMNLGDVPWQTTSAHEPDDTNYICSFYYIKGSANATIWGTTYAAVNYGSDFLWPVGGFRIADATISAANEQGDILSGAAIYFGDHTYRSLYQSYGVNYPYAYINKQDVVFGQDAYLGKDFITGLGNSDKYLKDMLPDGVADQFASQFWPAGLTNQNLLTGKTNLLVESGYYIMSGSGVDHPWSIVQSGTLASNMNSSGIMATITSSGSAALLFSVELSSTKADTTKVFLNADGKTSWGIPADTNPIFFNKKNPSDPTLSKSQEPALVVFYKDVIDSSFNIQSFTINLKFGGFSGVNWIQTKGPTGSGSLQNTSSANPQFVNPNAGGLYQFEGTIDTTTIRTSLILPLAGAEIKDVVADDITKADAFAAKVVAKYGILKRNLPVNGKRWFVIRGAGDYLGRPDNATSKACARFNPVNDAGGMGAVATWFGVPVRIAKTSNFLVGYASKKIGVFAISAWISQGIGTRNDASATASFYFGWDVASGTKAYSTDTLTMLRTNFYNADVKNIRLWPNNAAADNHVSRSILADFNTQFISPGFTEMVSP